MSSKRDGPPTADLRDARIASVRLGESQARILEHLKRRGSATIPDMASELGLSVETIRSHLKSLAREGLAVRTGSRSLGPGRPEIIYGLTEAADDLFPTGEGAVLRELATYLRDRGQSDMIDDFFDAQIERRRAAVKARLAEAGELAGIDEVARILDDEGFMAEVVTDPTGEQTLRLCHCPLRNLVDATRAPCRSELRFIRDILGRRLVRTAYIPAGDHSCSYRLEPEE